MERDWLGTMQRSLWSGKVASENVAGSVGEAQGPSNCNDN